MIRSLSSAMLTVFFIALYLQVFPTVYAADTVPPDITNVQITNVTEGEVTVTWETDEDADSTINYGLQEDYGIVRIPEASRTEH